MDQPVRILRGFFSAFFSLDIPTWAGFLAGWPGLPHNALHETWAARLHFAFAMFLRMPNDVRVAIMGHAIRYTMHYGPKNLLRSLSPEGVFGSYPPDPIWQAPEVVLGVPEAKEEAREMMRQFVPSEATWNQSYGGENTHVNMELTDEVIHSKTDTTTSGNPHVNTFPAPFN